MQNVGAHAWLAGPKPSGHVKTLACTPQHSVAQRTRQVGRQAVGCGLEITLMSCQIDQCHHLQQVGRAGATQVKAAGKRQPLPRCHP